MDLGFSEEQLLLGDAIGQLCADRFPLDALRALERRHETYPVDLWQALGELGVPGMAIPEAWGGLGMGLLDVAVAYDRFGRHLLPSPHWVSAILAARLLQLSGDTVLAGRWLPEMAAGRRVLTVASLEPGRGREDRPGDTRLERQGGSLRLTGTKTLVPYAAEADAIIVLAADGGRQVACLVPRGAAGVVIDPLPSLAGESLAALHLAEVKVAADQLLAGGRDITGCWREAMFQGLVPLAAQAVGAARRIHEISVGYAKEREAFGRQIGGFQAIAHDLADALVRIEGCQTLVHQAAWLHDQGRPFQAAAAMAKLESCALFRRVSALGVQVHGGLGYTMEADPQLFFRRAKQWQLLNWDDARLEDEIAALTLGRTVGDV
jgi:alkylation response protein AidB-like acyl-CoA dehydrogenase